MVALTQLVRAAREHGWAVADGDLASVVVDRPDWAINPSRRGGQDIDVLKPVVADAAPPRSLSAIYGLGAQPLHTDGAHHVKPPDIVLLSADTPSEVPTMLWRLDESSIPDATLNDMQHGIFTARTGIDIFLATVLTDGRLRFDPGCMTPSDSRAGRVLSYLTDLDTDVVEHAWTEVDQILAIDNRRVLHARGAATNDPGRTMRRLAIRLDVEGS